MPDLTLWGLFVAASVVLLLTPGPAVLYIVARSVEQGRAAGLVSVLGIHLGTTIHITAAAVGLSAVIVSSALAFALVKYFGAAYLIWIGIRTLIAKAPDPEALKVPAGNLQRAFRDGFVAISSTRRRRSSSSPSCLNSSIPRVAGCIGRFSFSASPSWVSAS